ncbi:TniQ family protein [Cognatiyoonia sp. IB215182]|uniref:TniQ family protein n=1 Tax=Cognatiyoonia sp. IB215182 TaxID=3097353 RepID=UPI002A155D3A|nr:TniQ family protein [Cognatiyoonia sp. IB215182]MDX8355642.1 TniQ family protein [Cognatiyoonia sp. IB215182]
MTGPLPVTLPPLRGELLSSWISRHADFYGVTPITMLRHRLPEAMSLTAIDLSLTKAQANQIVGMFGVSPRLVRRLSFAGVPKAAHRFIAKSPMQRCVRCTQADVSPPPVLRSALQGWRITCPHCGQLYQDKTNSDADQALSPYRAAARRGETLLNNHAERRVETWLSPLEIARLLLMRRIPWPPPRDGDLWRYRLLGAIVPDLDAILAKQTSFPYSPKHPILPLHIRPALLAGVAIIDRAGPPMLKMLEGHMMGDNKNRFVMATDHLVTPAIEWGPPQQFQLM